jgi:hypothetical protein
VPDTDATLNEKKPEGAPAVVALTVRLPLVSYEAEALTTSPPGTGLSPVGSVTVPVRISALAAVAPDKKTTQVNVAISNFFKASSYNVRVS